jgi:L-histidine Nalpha-methyltransferase
MTSTDRQRQQFLADALSGLAEQPRTLPCKYLYDGTGSALFEDICQTDDYYVTRADLALHEAHIGEISDRVGPQAHVIEFGSGAGIKTRKLLAGLERPRAYTPIEISAHALAASTRELKAAFPEIEIKPLRADYTRPIDAELLRLEPPSRRRVVYFPGSTISNFSHDAAVDFLRRMANIGGEGGAILIGVDLLKPEARLLQAYDDRHGVTAAFNLNLLARMQRELDADIEIDAFVHQARFNPEFNRIEMHLVACRPTEIRIGEHCFNFAPGESIHTENSHKYSVRDFRELASRAGLESVQVWKDPDGLFSMHWLEPTRNQAGS